MSATETTKEKKVELAGLVRDYVASCTGKKLTEMDDQFRRALSNKIDVELGDMEPAQVRRIYEANMELHYPRETDMALRYKLQTVIASIHGLKKLKNHKIIAP